MSNRQYGNAAPYRGNYPQDQVSPIGPFDNSREYSAPRQPSAVRSPPRKPVGVSSTSGAPPPPPHQNGTLSPARYRNQPSNIAGPQNYGLTAAGGALAGAVGSNRPIEASAQALRDIDNLYGGRMMSPSPEHDSQPQYADYGGRPRMTHQATNSQTSIAPLASHAAEMPMDSFAASQRNHAGRPTSDMTRHGYGYDQPMPAAGQYSQYRDVGYNDYVDPRDIADDGDDGFNDRPASRLSRLGGAAAAGGGVGAVTSAGILKAFGSRDTTGNYGQVPGGGNRGDSEKSEWLQSHTARNKKLKYVFGILGVLLVIGLIAGVVGGIVASNPGSDASSKPTSSSGALTINSPEVQQVLNNKNLHKVFPGIDYTPLNAQYPACLTNPPSQDNITLDVAILSQLTPAIRLYGTDCDQTQMVLKAIDNLGYNETVHVWLGVWLENNKTTNTRQLSQMYEILDAYPTSHFAGVIVGNEVLFRQDMTETQLGDELKTVRQKLKAKGINLPVATSDLGDDWNAALAGDSDIVMANVHPFFAGVTPEVAPGWTWEFFKTNDANLADAVAGPWPKSIISETGWPSQGGNDCGTGKKCATKTEGAVASIDNLNKYMAGWVCESMTNGTTYFWFEAFDEPWKVIFDDPKTGDFWEPHWGLMDVNRNLKSGVKIPDCGGRTVDKPY